MSDQNCRTCAFAEMVYRSFHANGTEEEYIGTCTRYPPVLIPHIAEDDDYGDFFENDFCWSQPKVNMLLDDCTDLCGEYVNKETGEKWSFKKVKSNEELKDDARKLLLDWASKPENGVKILELMDKS